MMIFDVAKNYIIYAIEKQNDPNNVEQTSNYP